MREITMIRTSTNTYRLAPVLMLSAGLALLSPNITFARARSEKDSGYPRITAQTSAAFPIYDTRIHYVGQVWASLTNWGMIGVEWSNRASYKDREALQINYSPSFEFPGGSRNDYIWAGGLWVGGIVGTDTLVSLPIDGVSRSAAGEFASYDTVRESSNLLAAKYYDPDAMAEQQYYARFSDTLIIGLTDELEGRLHHPLHIEVSQTSYAWSDNFSKQFVIVANWIKNIGSRPIDKMVFGIFVDADVLSKVRSGITNGWQDDVSGFISTAPNLVVPGFEDELNVAWVADNDGDPFGGIYPETSPRGMVGLRILHAPPVKHLSFNWWLTGGTSAQNWGPVKAGARTPAVGGGLGAPEGDRNRYYLMANGEVDYGQLFATLDFTSTGWRPPLRAGACDVADGLDTRQVLSVGPVCDPLLPGDSVPFVYALCAGDFAHTDVDRPFDCRDPYNFIAGLNSDDLAFAATWAGWIYDSPGVDTDGDGYRGEFHLVNCDRRGCDTVYYTGDLGPLPAPGEDCADYGGAPDLAGPASPPCPTAGQDMTFETRPGEVIVRWTGRNTETVRDPLSKLHDFEGYRLYVARTNSAARYSLIASWDLVDFQRYVYDPRRGGSWNAFETPVTLTDLQQQYGADFDPALYTTPSLATCFRDSIIDYRGYPAERYSYFIPQDYNRGNTYEQNGYLVDNIIQRVGDSLYVGRNDTVLYGIYEAHLTNLNPANSMYVSVTAFDHGNIGLGLSPMESPPGSCSGYAVPISSADVVEEQGLHVSVYPNPYKARYEGHDGRMTSYYLHGFEAPQKDPKIDKFEEQDRRIWFVNLPHEATIRIYTLDGDLIRTIHHRWPHPAGDDVYLSDYSSRVGWDLITRNTQAVTSGIYLYRVDSPIGSQTGKIVIVK
jgi:hypothetical protein